MTVLKKVSVKCKWCRCDSTNKKFHIGKEIDDNEKVVFRAICPKCTNVFYPDIQNAIKNNISNVIGIVIEKDISIYIRKHHDPFLFKVKGIVPKLKNAIEPGVSARGIPEKHRGLY